MRANLTALSLIMLVLCESASHVAAGTIAFDVGITGGTNIGAAAFTIGLTNGRSVATYINSTNMTILDFHFEWVGNVGFVAGVDGHPKGTAPYFGSYTYTAGTNGKPNTMDFYDGGVDKGPDGKGIAPGGRFIIGLSRFMNVASVKATASFAGGTGNARVTQVVPEPSSVILLALGLIGLSGSQVYRRRCAARCAENLPRRGTRAAS